MRKKFSGIIVFSALIITSISNIILFIHSFLILKKNITKTITINSMSVFFLVLSLFIFFNAKKFKWLGRSIKNDSYHTLVGYALAAFVAGIPLSLNVAIWSTLLDL